MRYLFFVFLSLVLLACNENKSATVKDSSKTTQVSSKKETKAQVGQKAVTPKSTMSSDVLFLAGKNTNIEKGKVGCMDIYVKNFNKIVSTQYSVNWNPKELKFKELKDFKLKDLSTNNFGKQLADKGKLTLSWFDQNVKGISLPEETPIYKICFEALANKGKKSKLIFTQDPIAVEITGPNATFLKFSSEPAYVVIK